jgi:FKBP-type peptidyl-prolyl cis-trans isomerase
VALMLAMACQPQQATQASLDTEEQQTSYALGYKLGENIQSLELSEVEIDALRQGLTDAANGTAARLDMAEAEPKVQQLAARRATRAAEDRRETEAAFLAKAAEEEGAVRTASGLVIVHTTEGEGASPAATDRVKVHYHGTFLDGSVFDSSVQRGQPAVFPLNGVIPCWTEALQLVKVGGKARVICPPEIAYGDRGAPPRIPPGASLIFEVELLEVVE